VVLGANLDFLAARRASTALSNFFLRRFIQAFFTAISWTAR
jgi:hypothetical protein